MENVITNNMKDEVATPTAKVKYLYYGSTGLLTLIMVFSVGNYLFNHDFIRAAFTSMGFPTYIIYPLAFAKVLGLLAVWSRKSKLLLGLAYSGFLYNFILAFFAHIMISDGEQWFAVVALIALGTSYFTSIKKFNEVKHEG